MKNLFMAMLFVLVFAISAQARGGEKTICQENGIVYAVQVSEIIDLKKVQCISTKSPIKGANSLEQAKEIQKGMKAEGDFLFSILVAAALGLIIFYKYKK